MKNFSIALLVAISATSIFASSTFGQRVLPTVNKIDFATGDRSTLSLYEGLNSAPNGISVAAGDIDGDGLSDFATLEHWGDPHENLNGVVVRGWDGTIKGMVSPPDATEFPARFVHIGRLLDSNDEPISVLFTGSSSSSPSPLYQSWRWMAPTSSLGDFQSSEPFPSPSTLDSEMCIVTNPLPTDEYGIVVGYQDRADHRGHVTVLKHSEPAQPGNSFQVSDNTYGGGVRVAVGDVDGDGVSEIATMSLGTMSGDDGLPQRCLDISVLTVEETAAETLTFSKITYKYSTDDDRVYAPIGDLPGGITVGDLDGDGRAEVVFTTASSSGPVVSYLDIDDDDDGLTFGSLFDVSITGLQDKDAWNSLTVLEPSFSNFSFSPIEGQPMGSLLLSTLVVPEPATLTLLGAVGALMLRRRV